MRKPAVGTKPARPPFSRLDAAARPLGVEVVRQALVDLRIARERREAGHKLSNAWHAANPECDMAEVHEFERFTGCLVLFEFQAERNVIEAIRAVLGRTGGVDPDDDSPTPLGFAIGGAFYAVVGDDGSPDGLALHEVKKGDFDSADFGNTDPDFSLPGWS